MVDSKPGDSRFRPYVVADTGHTVDDVFLMMNTAVWNNYGPDYSRFGLHKPIAAPLQNFVQLLEELTAIPGVRFVDHVEMSAHGPDPSELRVAFRHDIDSDIVGAIAQAEIQAEFGIRANWLILHTAQYYGQIDPETGQFMRNDSMIAIYRRFQDLGHEVSLHTDPLMLYQDHQIDGAEAFVTELEWLRSHGIKISGTTAHNYRPRYGAENYEIFTSVLSPSPDAQPLDATSVEHDGKVAPLRVLDDKALGLVYEGNQLFWNTERDVAYASAGPFDQWFFGNNRPTTHRFQQMDRTQVVREIRALGPGSDVVVVIHPEYLAVRHGPTNSPQRRIDRARFTRSPLGWTSYRPGSIVAVHQPTRPKPSGAAVRSFAQGCHVANEWGMIDLPIPDHADVVMAGSLNMTGRVVPMDSQIHRRLSEFVSTLTGVDLTITKVAHPAMAIDRLWSWINLAVDELRPKVVVLGVPNDLTADLGPGRWPKLSRAGTYLTIDAQGAVIEQSYPRQPRRTRLDSTAALRLYEWVIDRLQQRRTEVVLMVEGQAGSARSGAAFHQQLAGLAADRGVAFVDPTGGIDEEHQKLPDALRTDEWDADAHRAAAFSLLPVVLPLLGIDLPDLHVPTGAPPSLQSRGHLGMLNYPPPFTGARSVIHSGAVSTTDEHRRLIDHAVENHGLDYGDGIPVAAHHHRYVGHRRGLATTERAILTHDLRRDNAPTRGTGSWLAAVLDGVACGDIDHLLGVSAWGARSLPLEVEAAQGGSLLHSPFGRRDVAKLPPAIDAAHFPVAMIAIEISGSTAPEMLEPVDGSAPYVLVGSHALAHERQLASYSRALSESAAPLAVVDHSLPDTAIDVPAQSSLPALAVKLAPTDVISAAMHNVDPSAITAALGSLRQKFGLHFDLAGAHGDYTFYSPDGLASASARLGRVKSRRPGVPMALFADGQDAGQAAVAVGNDPSSPVHLRAALDATAARFDAPYGVSMYGNFPTAIEEPSDLVVPSVNNSGETALVLRTSYVAIDDPTAGVELLAANEFGDSEFQQIDRLAAAHFGTPGSDTRLWVTRPSVLAAYSNAHRHLPWVTTRNGDRIDIANIAANADSSAIGAKLGETDLYGVSFESDDPAGVTVALDGQQVDPLIRWFRDAAVTAAPCGIRWPIIGAADPILVAGQVGDLANVDVTGDWAWTTGSDDAGSSGRLTVTTGSEARLRIDLDRLDPRGAQIIAASLRVGANSAVSVQCHTEGGDVFVLESADAAAGSDGVESFEIRPTGAWATHAAPTWAFTPTAEQRTIRRVDVVVEGAPGSWVDIADLWLGRPRRLPQQDSPLALLGGDALGASQVTITAMAEQDRSPRPEPIVCDVDADGTFVSPRLEPGAYLVAADGADPIIVQVASARFDVDLRLEGTR